MINIVDHSLHLFNDEVIQAQQLLNITLLCSLNDGDKRPSMAHVVAMLQGEVKSKVVKNDLKLGRSTIESFKRSLLFIDVGSKLELSNISNCSEGNSQLAYNHSSANVNPRNSCLSTNIELNNVYNEITTIDNHEIYWKYIKIQWKI